MRNTFRSIAVLLALHTGAASAQQFPTVPSGTVIGRSQIGVGPAQAIPFSQLIALMLSSTLNVPTLNTNSVVFKGSISGQATLQAQAAAGTPTLNLPTGSGTLASSAASPIALDPITGIVSCPSCVTSVAAASPIIPSRAVGQTLNLSSFAGLVTAGYAGSGDGGSATFKNVGSAAFIDSYITTFTRAGGSGYTNGSYFGVFLSNTTKPFAIGTATVSGGVVTAVNIAGTPGGQCNVGDVYTTSSIPGGTGFSITVTGCSAPLGSFSDSVGTHFQIVYDGASPNIKQFGAIGDYRFENPDASATDNFNSIQAALWFAGFTNGIVGGGDFWGGRLWVPQGSFLACGTGSVSLIVPNGVTLEGASNQGAVIHMCDAFSTSTHFVTLCDSNWHTACFNSIARHIQFSAKPGVAAAGVFCMVYSNATQDFGGLYDVYIYAGGRCGVWLEKGYGGASTVHLEGISITALSVNPQIRIGDTIGSGLNYGTTIVTIREISLGGPSSGSAFQTGSGILIQGGFPSIENVHCEGMPICIEVGIPSGTGNGEMVRIHNVNAGSGAPAPACSGTIALDPTNNPGNTIIGQVPAGSCSNVVANEQPGGGSRGTAIGLDVVFSP